MPGSVGSWVASTRAVLSGGPVELVLYLSGRRGAAEVVLSGDEAAVAKLEATASGL